MRRNLFGATALSMGLSMSLATAGQAQSVADQVVSQLQADGFDRIEVTNGRTQVKIEAIRGETQVEFVYDLTTGALIEQEVYPVDGDEDIRPGVVVRTRDRDFSDDDEGDDESSPGRDDDEPDDDERDDESRDDERDDDERDDDERDDEDEDEDDDDEDDEDDDEEDDDD